MIESAAMLVGEAADAEGDFQRRAPAEHVQAHGGGVAEGMSPAELREALERTHELQVSRINSAGEEFMKTAIRRFDGGLWTRITYVFYATSHEDYHRGQLAMYARSMGLVPALTQQIRGANAT
jgi:uncharacterized damage-inducible protein DinB